ECRREDPDDPREAEAALGEAHRNRYSVHRPCIVVSWTSARDWRFLSSPDQGTKTSWPKWPGFRDAAARWPRSRVQSAAEVRGSGGFSPQRERSKRRKDQVPLRLLW